MADSSSPLDYSRLYARYHPDDPAHREGLRLLHERLLAPVLPADRDAPILDVGCGRGYVLQDLQRLGYGNVAGIDADPGQVDFARDAGLPVEHVADSAAYLATQPGRYAVILLMDVLEHVPRADQPALLRAIAHALRPGGVLLCTVPNAASAIGSYWFHNDYTHRWSFTDDSLTGLIEQCGFGPAQCGGIEFFPRPRFLFWFPTARTVQWWLRGIVRCRQRLTLIAELGWTRGRRVVLTPNLVALARKAP